MMNQTIQNLINSHVTEKKRQSYEKSQPFIRVSKAGSFFAVLYEKVRNTVEYDEEHLFRKRAIKRILIRMKALRQGNPEELADILTKEVILAQYLNDHPVPVNKIGIVARTISKYQNLSHSYKEIFGRKLNKKNAETLYSLCAFEIERIYVPYNSKDALVNTHYNFVNNMGILRDKNLRPELESLQNYISVHRAVTKSDNEIISFHLFFFKLPFWANPTLDQIKMAANNLDAILAEIDQHLQYKPSKRSQKEIVRQSIPFKILDKIIISDIDNAQTNLEDHEKLNKKIEEISNFEYRENKRRLTTTIIRSIIYIFITKIVLALIIEVPYELKVEDHINFVNLGINILFPVLTMFVVANSFSIPNKKNTELLKQMISAIITKNTDDDEHAFAANVRRPNSAFIFVFRAVYFVLFFLIFGVIIYTLYLLNFNLPGMFIFVIFFSTILFVAVRLRNTASELRVVQSSPSVFSPIIDMVAAPILILGKKLSEGASQVNFLTVFLDFIIEAPFKSIVRVFEEWNSYVRETREEIV
jgi:hypothetical protein